MFIKSTQQLSSNLKRLIAVRNITFSELAKELNIPRTTLHRIISGQTQRPKNQIIKNLAQFFAISVDELVGEEEIEWGNIDGWLHTIISKNQTIPLCSWELDEFDQLQEIKSDERIVITNSISDYCFALKVKDSAMEPLFPPNSIIICDPKKEYFHGSYVLVKLKNAKKLFLRKLIQDVHLNYIRPLNDDFEAVGTHTHKLTKEDKIIATVVCALHYY